MRTTTTISLTATDTIEAVGPQGPEFIRFASGAFDPGSYLMIGQGMGTADLVGRAALAGQLMAAARVIRDAAKAELRARHVAFEAAAEPTDDDEPDDEDRQTEAALVAFGHRPTSGLDR